MMQKGLPGATVETGKFGPGIQGAHVDRADCLDPWLRWFDPEEARRFAALDATPELSLGRGNEVLIERIGVGGDFDPFAPASDDREDRGPGRHHPHIVLELRHVFFGRGLF